MSYNRQSGRTVAKVVSDFPQFSDRVLQHIIEGDCVEEQLTSALCPVWSGKLKAKGVYAAEIFYFCEGCSVQKKLCPAYKFDVQKLQFKTFQREGEAFINGRERIQRLIDSPYLPVSPLMFASLIKRQTNGLFGRTVNIRVGEGMVSCDAFLYTSVTDAFATALSAENRRKISLMLANNKFNDCFVTSFYNWKTTGNRWAVRDNTLDYQSNRPIYSVVMEP